MRSLFDLTVRSLWAHMNSQCYHTELTVWDHYLFSLWTHGELTSTQCFITLDSRHEIIIWSLTDLTVISFCTHMNSQFYHTGHTVWDHYLFSLWDHGELTWTQCFITLDTHSEIINWSLSDLTVRSCCTHMNSQFYHTRHTVWDHNLFSLWDHGELTWTQCFITLDSHSEIINWSLSDLTVRSCCTHMNSQFYHTRHTVWDHCLFSLWDHGELTLTQCFITLDSQNEINNWSLSDLTVRSCCAHMNSEFYHTRHTVWDHHLFSLWDHGELTLTQCFIALDSQGEIINWSLSELTVRSCYAHMN